MIGKAISHYRILSEVGRGGMGIVYEAEDLLLGRRVALKFLPDEVAHEPQALARFQREARAASSLNHPNICTIYEIVEEEKRWFIAMELLEGISLDLSLANKATSLGKLLDWGIQISDALDDAHAKGIVHRDLKPSNIFLTKRGQLKVLDFGLAKMTDPELDAASLTSPNLTARLPSPLTSPGLAIGTIAFMSPEQARGADLDARSDLFSLGTILFQMAAGRMPFEGKTSAMIFDALLNREPAPLSELNPSLPPELQRIVGKCLEKNPDLRYQHASELRVDLKRLQRDSTSAQFRGISDSGQALAGPHPAPADSTPVPANLAHSSPPQASSSKSRSFASSQIVNAASGTGFVVGGIFVIAILAAAAFGIYELLHRPTRLPFQNMVMTRLTSAGNNWAAAMSPDGKYLATLRRETDGRDSLWMQHLATSSSTQIVPPGDAAILDVTFSPDGDYVYFRSHPALIATNDLYRVPVLGGSIASIVHDIDSTPSFSSAAGLFCFVRYKRSENKQWLISVNADGSNPKVIFSGSGPTYSKPAWSPDGKHIVVGEEKQGVVSELTIFDAGRGVASHFFTLADSVSSVQSLAWTPDGQGVIVVYRNIAIGGAQIAQITYPEPSFHRVTNDLNWYGPVSLSADGKTISTVLTTVDEEVKVFTGTGHPINESTAISLGPAFWLDWVNNDQLVLSKADYSGIELLSVGSGQRSTLFSGSELHVYDIDKCGPSAVVFTGVPSMSSDVSHTYALDLAGGSPRQVTYGNGDQFHRCTPDGRELIYFSFEDSSIHKISMQGGKAEMLVSSDKQPEHHFSITSDGKELVAIMRAQVKQGPEINFLSIETGQVTRRIPIIESAERFQITPDGLNIAFVIRERGVDNLWLQSVGGGKPNQLTDFHLARSTSQGIQSYAWSPDGKRLAISRRLSKGDVVLLQDQNK